MGRRRVRAVARDAALDCGQDRERHRAERAQRLVAVLARADVAPRRARRGRRARSASIRTRDLDAVAGGERERREEVAAAGGLARERLGEAASAGQWRFSSGRAISSVTRPPSWAMHTVARRGRAARTPPLTKWTPGRRAAGRGGRAGCAGSESSVSASMKRRCRRWSAAARATSRRPCRARGRSSASSSSCCEDARAGARGIAGGAVARRAVDDDAPRRRARRRRAA